MDGNLTQENCGAWEPPIKPKYSEYQGYQGYAMSNNIGYLIIWFLILFVVVVLALYALKPTFVLKRNSVEVDNGKVVTTAFVISAIIVIIIWLIGAYAARS